MKIVNIEEWNFQERCKIRRVTILEATKRQVFALSLKSAFLEKPQEVVKLTPPSLFRVIKEVKANEKKMKKDSDLHKTEKRRYEEDFQKHQKDHIDKWRLWAYTKSETRQAHR